MSQVVPATFTLDLGKPAGELRTMGTAGLTAPDKNPGSYLFLTLADPATRRGVVAGWLTEDRGSGVLFSDVKDGKVAFRARIDYGHLQIPAGKSAALETLAIGIFDDARIGEEQYADAIAKHYRIKLHPQPIGYCTWYSDVAETRIPSKGPARALERERYRRVGGVRRKGTEAVRLFVRPDRPRVAGRRRVQRPATRFRPREAQRPLSHTA